MPRSLDNWQPWYDDQGAPFYGRMTFYKLHTTDLEEIYNYDATVALDNPILTSQYGITSQQVFLADVDYTIVMEKYIGPGPMVVDDPDTTHWKQIRVFDNLAPSQQELTPGGDVSNLIVAGTTQGSLPSIDGNPEDNLYAMVTGYYEIGDMPAQYYKLEYNVDPGLVDDGGSMIRPSGSTNTVWRLIPQENIDCRVFGVFPTEAITTVESYSSQLRNCFTYANAIGKDVYMPRVYESTSYYWLDGGTYGLGQKLHIDAGARIIGKPVTSSTMNVDEIEYFGDNLFISEGDYGTLKINCPVVYSRWISPNIAQWNGTIRKMILDGYTSNESTLTIKGCEVDILKEVAFHNINFENCTITGNGWFSNCTLKFKNCGYISDKYVKNSCTVAELSGNLIRLENFSNANKYIAWKNIQGEHDYGSLGEQTLNNAQIFSPCVLENASGTITYMGGPSGTTVEMHNVSGTITGDFENTILNLVDCWTTLVNTNANNDVRSIQHRRGSLISNTLVNLHDDSYFEGVDIRAALVTPEGKSIFKDCHIRNTLATFEVDCFDCFIYATVTTYPNPATNIYTFRFEGCTFELGGHHQVTGQNAGGLLQNCSWINNINKSGIQFVSLNRDVLDADDTHHTYVYEGNNGANTLQYKAAKWTGKLHDPNNASCGKQIGSWSPSSGGPSFVTWTWTGAAMLVTGQAATDINLYIVEFQMFSVGTTNLGQLSLRTTPPSVVGIPDPYQPTHVRKSYVNGTAMTASLSDVERTRAEWQYDQTGTPFCKGYAYAGGYNWRVTNAGTMFAVNSSLTELLDSDFNFEIYQ